MDKIIEYLKDKYKLSSMIRVSDRPELFEAIAMGPTSPFAHETGELEGVKLDVLVYPRDIFYGEIALEDFEAAHEGLVVLDSDGMGSWLKRMIAQQIASIPLKPREAVADSLHWCRSMAERAATADAEGLFCRHWLLTDSVEVYSDVMGQPFLSPARTMSKMAKTDPEAAEIHLRAMGSMERQALNAWVELLEKRFAQAG